MSLKITENIADFFRKRTKKADHVFVNFYVIIEMFSCVLLLTNIVKNIIPNSIFLPYTEFKSVYYDHTNFNVLNDFSFHQHFHRTL